jgi:hypothetical protein
VPDTEVTGFILRPTIEDMLCYWIVINSEFGGMCGKVIMACFILYESDLNIPLLWHW